jgi:low temperature requirement protein LtrA
VFAALISQVGSPLAIDYSFHGILRYELLLTLVFLAWLGYTTFSTQLASDDLVEKLLIVAQIFLIAVMAANANTSLSSREAAGFGAAYGVVRVILALQYWRVISIAISRAIVRRRIIRLLIAAALWGVSAFLPAPERYNAWVIALSVDLTTSWPRTNETLLLPTGAVHFAERFGLLTIILLGELLPRLCVALRVSQPGVSRRPRPRC